MAALVYGVKANFCSKNSFSISAIVFSRKSPLSSAKRIKIKRSQSFDVRLKSKDLSVFWLFLQILKLTPFRVKLDKITLCKVKKIKALKGGLLAQ